MTLDCWPSSRSALTVTAFRTTLRSPHVLPSRRFFATHRLPRRGALRRRRRRVLEQRRARCQEQLGGRGGCRRGGDERRDGHRWHVGSDGGRGRRGWQRRGHGGRLGDGRCRRRGHGRRWVRPVWRVRVRRPGIGLRVLPHVDVVRRAAGRRDVQRAERPAHHLPKPAAPEGRHGVPRRHDHREGHRRRHGQLSDLRDGEARCLLQHGRRHELGMVRARPGQRRRFDHLARHVPAAQRRLRPEERVQQLSRRAHRRAERLRARPCAAAPLAPLTARA